MTARIPALLLAFAAVPVGAATVRERSVDLEVHGTGLRETASTVIELEEAGDLTAFSEYPVVLDANIELDELAAEVLDGAGRVVERVPRRRCREITSAGSGLHTSTRVLMIPFPRLEVGQRLRVRTVRELRPYFPAHQVFLQLDMLQRKLEVRIHGAGEGFRWQAPYTGETFAIREVPGGLEVTGSDVPRAPSLDDAAAEDSGEPLVRFSWGSNRSWADVGRWYAGLVGALPRSAAPVRALAARVAGGADDPLEKVRLLTRHVQQSIRYEAVEVGVGGYVPTPAAETLARGWGDCKDKSELLAELLRAVGIPAHLALVRLGHEGRVPRDFPSPLQFNHCIVAVPSEALAGREDDPPAPSGFIFLDPTLEDVPPTWLNPEIQAHLALVEAGDESREVIVPARTDLETRSLEVEGTLDGEGTFVGAAVLRLAGESAMGWRFTASTTERLELEADLRRTLGHLFAGARIASVTGRRVEAEVPSFEIEGELTLPHFATGTVERLRIRPAMLVAFPEPRSLEDRAVPVVATPRVSRSRWVIRLPEGACAPEAGEQRTANEAGSLRQSLSSDSDGRLVVEVEARVEHAFFEPGELAPLRELAVSEARARKRSVRLSCAGASRRDGDVGP